MSTFPFLQFFFLIVLYRIFPSRGDTNLLHQFLPKIACNLNESLQFTCYFHAVFYNSLEQLICYFSRLLPDTSQTPLCKVFPVAFGFVTSQIWWEPMNRVSMCSSFTSLVYVLSPYVFFSMSG